MTPVLNTLALCVSTSHCTEQIVWKSGLEWERIFANPTATAAAIDRVVHHSVILEFDVPSYRTNAAQQRVQAEEVNRQN